MISGMFVRTDGLVREGQALLHVHVKKVLDAYAAYIDPAVVEALQRLIPEGSEEFLRVVVAKAVMTGRDTHGVQFDQEEVTQRYERKYR